MPRKRRRQFTFPAGPCANCGRKAPKNKLWCNIKCQNEWYKALEQSDKESGYAAKAR
jgi:hypothetical protein